MFHILQVQFLSTCYFWDHISWDPSHETHMRENERALANPLSIASHSYRQLPGGMYICVLYYVFYMEEALHMCCTVTCQSGMQVSGQPGVTGEEAGVHERADCATGEQAGTQAKGRANEEGTKKSRG